MPSDAPLPRIDPLSSSTLTGHARARWSWGVIVAIGAHVAMFGGALLYAHLTPPHTVPPKPIMARLVRLGKPPDAANLPRLHAPVSRPSTQKTAPTPAPAVPDNAIAVPTKSPAEERKSEAKERQEKLQKALKMLGTPDDEPTSDKGDAPPGQEDGTSDGTAEKAEEGNKYIAQVVAALKANFVVPSTITDKQRLILATAIRLYISENGKISNFKIEIPSGNEVYDDAVRRMVQTTDKLPPPPKDLADQYSDSGLGFRFKPM